MARKPPLHILIISIMLTMCSVLCQGHQSSQKFQVNPKDATFTVLEPPSEFIKNLNGCQKGQAADDLPKLKRYLERFGYLENHGQTLSAGMENVFDEDTEKAVKAYQTLYHLQPTGTLDDDTLKQMVKPRCGFPDIIHRPQMQQESSGLFHTVQHYSHFPDKPKWEKFNLTYGFNGVPKEIVKMKTMKRLISRALERWQTVTEFRFTRAKRGEKPDIEIGFRTKKHDDEFPFDGSGGTLAHAISPPFGKFHYDADEKWSTEPEGENDEFDLESLAIHELGHNLGLFHSDVPESIMYPSISPGVIKRELHQDDINGIRDLYGLPVEFVANDKVEEKDEGKKKAEEETDKPEGWRVIEENVPEQKN